MSELRRRLEEAEERLRQVLAGLAVGSVEGVDREELERCRLVAGRVERKALSLDSRLAAVTDRARAA